MNEPIFENVNEDGEVYFSETLDKLALGLDLLQTYPNDSIVIRIPWRD